MKNALFTHKIQLSIVVVLSALALALGYAILVQKSDSESQSFLVQGPTSSTSESVRSSGTTINNSVLNFPPPEAPKEERDAHYELAISMAQKSKTLDVSNCSGNPTVLLVKLGDMISIKNTDNALRAIIFGPEDIFEIAASSDKEFEINDTNFKHGPGIYGYGCDLIPGTGGLIYVAP